jgi:hypothetical protein
MVIRTMTATTTAQQQQKATAIRTTRNDDSDSHGKKGDGDLNDKSDLLNIRDEMVASLNKLK